MSHTVSAGEKHKKSLIVVLGITLSYLIIEVVVGFLANSLALLSDAAHMLTDVAGIALALFAIWMASKPRTNRKTFGYYRLEILSALTNGIILIFISMFILFEAWDRFFNPQEVAGLPVLIVAFFGLIINLISMKLLAEGSEESINLKGAFLEVLSDMLSSIGVIIAGIVILTTGWVYIDPIVSALIGLFILPRTFNLIKESVNVLLEAVPSHIEYEEVEKYIKQRPSVKSLHDLHIWTITSGIYALSAHLVMKEEFDFPQINQELSEIKAYLNKEFKIEHTTLEVHSPDDNYNPYCFSCNK